MTHETFTPARRFELLHLQMISKVENCLYRLRDMNLHTQHMRVNADAAVLSNMQIERNMLVALLGELNASLKNTVVMDDETIAAKNVLQSIHKLRERVRNAEEHFMHTCTDVEEVMRKAS